MTKTSRTAIPWFRSGNPKSPIQNPKWGWCIAVVVTLTLCWAVAQAQQAKKVPQIGYLRYIENPFLDEAFRKGLRELGYVEGQNIHVEDRYAGGSLERVAELAAELVSLKVDVTVASSLRPGQAKLRRKQG